MFLARVTPLSRASEVSKNALIGTPRGLETRTGHCCAAARPPDVTAA
jgi:hypothetical protein